MNEILKYKNIIVGIIIAIFFLVFFRMSYSSYDRKMQKLDRELQEIQRKEKLIKDAVKLDKEVKKLKSQFFKGNILDAKTIIEQVASDKGVIINLVKPRFTGEEGDYAVVDLVLAVQADYRGLIDFLKVLEERYFLQVKSIKQQKGQRYQLLIKLFLAQ